MEINQNAEDSNYRQLKLAPSFRECLLSEGDKFATYYGASYDLYFRKYYQCKEEIDRQFDQRIRSLERLILSTRSGHRTLQQEGMSMSVDINRC